MRRYKPLGSLKSLLSCASQLYGANSCFLVHIASCIPPAPHPSPWERWWVVAASAGSYWSFGSPLSYLGFPCGSAGKESACNVGDGGLIPGLGRSHGEGKGYPLQDSGLENSKGITKSQTLSFTFIHIWRPEITDGCDISCLLIWLEIHFTHIINSIIPWEKLNIQKNFSKFCFLLCGITLFIAHERDLSPPLQPKTVPQGSHH